METLVEILKWLSLALVGTLVIAAVVTLVAVIIRRVPLGWATVLLSRLSLAIRWLGRKTLAIVVKLAIWKFITAWWSKKPSERSRSPKNKPSFWQSKAIYLLICLVVATLLVRGTKTLASNIPWATLLPYFYMALVILVLAVLIGWLAKNPEHRARATKWPWGKIIGWSAALLILYLVGPSIYRYATTPENEMIVTQAWSDPPLEVPPGTDIVWERLSNAAYQIMTADGRIYYFERDPLEDTRTPCERHFRIPGSLGSVRFRVVDKEIVSTKFIWRYYLYGQAPCANVKAEEEEMEPPPLPDGIPDEKSSGVLSSY
jgi:hypothetical protein